MNELFDVLRSDGEPTDATKTRAEVHRDGDWHRTFHLWITWFDPDGQVKLLFQRRASDKDTGPGRIDVPVGGHFGAGETLNDVMREVDEELGFSVPAEELIPLGTRRVESVTPEWIDREFQQVYVLVVPASLPVLRPSPVELADLFQVRSLDVISLFQERGDAFLADRAPVLPSRRLGDWSRRRLTRRDFIPVPDGYWARCARACELVLDGEPPPAWDAPETDVGIS